MYNDDIIKWLCKIWIFRRRQLGALGKRHNYRQTPTRMRRLLRAHGYYDKLHSRKRQQSPRNRVELYFIVDRREILRQTIEEAYLSNSEFQSY